MSRPDSDDYTFCEVHDVMLHAVSLIYISVFVLFCFVLMLFCFVLFLQLTIYSIAVIQLYGSESGCMA